MITSSLQALIVLVATSKLVSSGWLTNGSTPSRAIKTKSVIVRRVLQSVSILIWYFMLSVDYFQRQAEDKLSKWLQKYSSAQPSRRQHCMRRFSKLYSSRLRDFVGRDTLGVMYSFRRGYPVCRLGSWIEIKKSRSGVIELRLVMYSAPAIRPADRHYLIKPLLHPDYPKAEHLTCSSYHCILFRSRDAGLLTFNYNIQNEVQYYGPCSCLRRFRILYSSSSRCRPHACTGPWRHCRKESHWHRRL